jgi:hypothetical protein
MMTVILFSWGLKFLFFSVRKPTSKKTQKTLLLVGAVAHAYKAELHLTNKKLSMVAHTCHHSYMGSINRRITVQASLGIKSETLLKKQ